MQSPSVTAVQIMKFTSTGSDKNPFESQSAEDLLAVEEPLEIRIIYGETGNRQTKNISITMCTPGQDEELAAGFLFTEGIISRKAEILCINTAHIAGNHTVTVELEPSVTFDPQKIERHFYTSSSCGVCGKSSIEAVKQVFPAATAPDSIRISAERVITLPQLLRKNQEVFTHTGGLHASALFDLEGNLWLVREDVGRHNALDKLIGSCLLEDKLPLEKHILLLSGRASFELIQKAAMAGVRMVCAVGAPSSLAVELAKETGITLLGFLRDGRFNIYTGGQRLGD